MEKARKEKNNMKQAELARLCSIDSEVVRDLEAGKKVPDGHTMGLIERHLGVNLRGDNFGQPRQFVSKAKKEAAKKEAAEKKAAKKEAKEKETEKEAAEE